MPWICVSQLLLEDCFGPSGSTYRDSTFELRSFGFNPQPGHTLDILELVLASLLLDNQPGRGDKTDHTSVSILYSIKLVKQQRDNAIKFPPSHPHTVTAWLKICWQWHKTSTSNRVFKENRCPPWWIFSFSTAVTLKIRSSSPNSKQYFVMSQLYIHVNLVRIQPLVQKILCRQESVIEFSVFLLLWPWKFGHWSRSPKSNHFFVMSQLYIQANLVRI